MRNAPGLTIAANRRINARFYYRKTLPVFEKAGTKTLFGKTSFASTDSGRSIMSSDGKFLLYDIDYTGTGIIRVTNDSGKLYWSYFSNACTNMSWRDSGINLASSISPFVLKNSSGEVYIGYVKSGSSRIYFRKLNESSTPSLGSEIESNIPIISSQPYVLRSVLGNDGKIYIIGITIGSYSPNISIDSPIAYLFMHSTSGSLTSFSQANWSVTYLENTDSVTSFDAVYHNNKIFVFTARDNGAYGVVIKISPETKSIAHSEPLISVNTSQSDDYAIQFSPHFATVITDDTGEKKIVVCGDYYRKNIYFKKSSGVYEPGNSLVMYASGDEYFGFRKESYITYRPKDQVPKGNTGKLVVITSGSYKGIYYLEFGNDIYISSLVPMFGETAKTEITQINQFSVAQSENSPMGLTLTIPSNVASDIQHGYEIIFEAGYNNVYVTIGVFDVVSMEDIIEIDEKNYTVLKKVDAISRGIGRLSMFESDFFYEFWGTRYELVTPANFMGKMAVVNTGLSNVNGYIDMIVTDPNTRAFPILTSLFTNSLFYQIAAVVKINSGSNNIDFYISPAGYISNTDTVSKPAGFYLNIYGTASGNTRNIRAYYNNDKYHVNLNGSDGPAETISPFGSGEVSILTTATDGMIINYVRDTNGVYVYHSFTYTGNKWNGSQTKLSMCYTGYSVKYDTTTRTTYGSFWNTSWNDVPYPFLTAISDGTTGYQLVVFPSFSFDFNSDPNNTWYRTNIYNVLNRAPIQQMNYPSGYLTQFDSLDGNYYSLLPFAKMTNAYTPQTISTSFAIGNNPEGRTHQIFWKANTQRMRWTFKVNKSLVYTSNLLDSGLDSYRGLYTIYGEMRRTDGKVFPVLLQVMGTMPEVSTRGQSADPNNVYFYAVRTPDRLDEIKGNYNQLTLYPSICVWKIYKGNEIYYDHQAGIVPFSNLYPGDNYIYVRGTTIRIGAKAGVFKTETVTTISKEKVAYREIRFATMDYPICMTDALKRIADIVGIRDFTVPYKINGTYTKSATDNFDIGNAIYSSSARISYRVSSLSSISGKRIGIYNYIKKPEADTTKGYVAYITYDGTNIKLVVEYIERVNSSITQRYTVFSIQPRFYHPGEYQIYASDYGFTFTLDNKVLISFPLDYSELTADINYTERMLCPYTSGSISLHTKWSELDEVFDYFSIDANTTAIQSMDYLIDNRRIYYIDTPTGGIKIYRDPNIVNNQSTPYDAIPSSHQEKEFQIPTRLRIEGDYAIEIIDGDLMAQYGNNFHLLNTQNIMGIGSLFREGKYAMRDFSMATKRYRITGGADPRIEPGDVLYLRANEGANVVTKQVYIKAITMYGYVTPTESAFDMEIDATEYIA